MIMLLYGIYSIRPIIDVFIIILGEAHCLNAIFIASFYHSTHSSLLISDSIVIIIVIKALLYFITTLSSYYLLHIFISIAIELFDLLIKYSAHTMISYF
jgi:hypothetical protein